MNKLEKKKKEILERIWESSVLIQSKFHFLDLPIDTLTCLKNVGYAIDVYVLLFSFLRALNIIEKKDFYKRKHEIEKKSSFLPAEPRKT